MSDLLTVYDDDQANTFIDCMICDKRIRGETHYKIHVTTVQHLKKEESFASQGKIPRQPPLPEWKDIVEYLKYLNLDEPIIGLGSLKQIPDHVTDDGKAVLKYKCRLCAVDMDLFSMVAHIVGRKHRQKYLELKRPDLVTWHDNAQKQPGLVARAKAAVVEKQEGWGTPVALRRDLFTHFQGRDLQSSVHEQPHYGQDFNRESPLAKDMHKQTYLKEQGRPYYTGEEYDQYDRPNPDDAIRQQSYPEGNRHQKPYEEAEMRGRGLRGDNYPDRAEREMHTRSYADQGGRSLREDYEGVLDQGQFSRGDRHVSIDVQEKVYNEGMPRNRFNDKDLRIQRPAESKYQAEQMECRRYAAYEEEKTATKPMPMHERSFRDEERRGTVRELHREAWDNANEMQGYPHMLDPRDPRAYSQEAVPAKKKKKSRFSDATAEEIALAHMRHTKKPSQKEKQRGTQFRANPPPPSFNNQFVDPGSTSQSHLDPKHENVLDILSDIQIENMDDARFLKEKLCSVLKEFQAKKSGADGGPSSQSASDHRGLKQTDQRRDAYKDPRDDPDGMYSENRGFQEIRRYENDPRNFQESRQYGDDPRDFREVRQSEDDPRGLRETRHYEEDYKEPNRFDGYPSGHQETRPYADDPRGFQNSRLQENPQGLPERRLYDEDPRDKEQNYEDYSRASREPAPRRSQETRYYEGNYRGFGNFDSERRRSFEHFEGRGPAGVERGFQESFGKPPGNFPPTSLQEEARMYVGRGQQRSHQNDRQTGDEPYDPFHPSSSPPQEASTSTSLDKIASTLLELVARR
ncbi:trichohyalin isoform X1 [Pseudorasbora parva]|uniref:trichohyalin isoform X1 n=2 Tax=Pseudorasbora parva TaxID=51549 RepID=UPI00351F0CAF